MGLFFNVHPPENLAKLDQQKRKALATAIREVLQTDPEVQKLLRDKTMAKYEELVRQR